LDTEAPKNQPAELDSAAAPVASPVGVELSEVSQVDVVVTGAAPDVLGEAESTDIRTASSLLETYQDLDRILEALLLAADQPLSLDQLQRLLMPELNLSKVELRAALATLAARLDRGACVLTEVASGWRVQVSADYSRWVSRLWQEKPQKFSRAALETLALVVYRQPITRGEIEDVRGVAVSSNILRGLVERGWIREVGHKEVPGRPALFATTPQFLDDFGLKALDQLPALPDIKDVEQLELALARLTSSQHGAEPAEATDDAADAAGTGDAEFDDAGKPPQDGSQSAHPIVIQ